jgi:hypothetical protein
LWYEGRSIPRGGWHIWHHLSEISWELGTKLWWCWEVALNSSAECTLLVWHSRLHCHCTREISICLHHFKPKWRGQAFWPITVCKRNCDVVLGRVGWKEGPCCWAVSTDFQ